MGDMRLNALSIDELRDLFSGSAESAARLRALAAAAFPVETAPPATLLSRIGGPLTRRAPNAPVVRPSVPTGGDLNALLAGHYIAPERLTAAWALVRVWLDDASWGSLTLDIDEADINDLDFELGSAGLESRFALRKLFNDRLALPLPNAPGQATGYVRSSAALAMRDAWLPALGGVGGRHAEAARRVVAWLEGFDDWCRAAEQAGRPAPDLIASYTVPA